MIKIGDNELIEASTGHIERTQLFGPKPIDRILESVGIDAQAFGYMANVLRELREPGSVTGSEAYSAGMIDGAVVIARAFSIAHEREDRLRSNE